MSTATSRRVAVLTHIGRREAVDAALRFLTGLGSRGIVGALPPMEFEHLSPHLPEGAVERLDLAGGHQGCEVAAVFGGDGTILRGAEWAVTADVPLLGVNLGHVGFLAEAESSEIDGVVRQVVERSYEVEQRVSIGVNVFDPAAGPEPVWSSFAVNEVSLEKAARERMLEVMVEIDRRPLSRWGCDGVLISTPTGSTAYAFSAGGPVMWPQVEALLLVPLSAHALFARPLVLSPQTHIRLELLTGVETRGVVWCDGRRTTELAGGMQIEVCRFAHPLRLARLSASPFTDRLVRKFDLRVEGWRGSGAQRLGRPGEPEAP